MAVKIPLYNQQSTAEGLIQANAKSELGVDPMGAALEKFGNAAAHAGGIGMHILQEKEATDASAQATKILAQAHQDWSNFQDSVYNSATDGAPDFTKNMMDSFDAWAEKTSTAVSNPHGQKMLQNGLINLRTSLFDSSKRMEASASAAFKAQSINDASETYARMVSSGTMPYDVARTNIMTSIANTVLDPTARAKLAEFHQTQLSKAYLNGKAYRDPLALIQQAEMILGGKGDQGAGAEPSQKPYDGSGNARGLRNNNPGNISKTSNMWDGEVEGSDSRFKTFASPEHGIAAIGKNLLAYDKKGINTVASIINKWAPPNENDTGAYVANVAKSLGVDPNQKLDLKDPAIMAGITKAIIKVENGSQPYSDEQINHALGASMSGTAPTMASRSPIDPEVDRVLSHLPYDQVDSFINLAKQNVRASYAEQELQRREQERQLKAAQESTLNDMLTSLTDGKLTVAEVIKNPTLDFAQKEHMINAINSASKRGDDTDPKVFNDLFFRINASDMNPNRLSDPNEIIRHVGNGLSYEDANKLRAELAGKKDPEHQLIAAFKKYAHDQISGKTDFFPDPEGEKLYYEWDVAITKAMKSKREAGVPLINLLDPTSKDYLGKNLPKRSMNQKIESVTNLMTGNSASTPVDDAQKRLPTESFEEWQARMNEFGKMGATFDNWAKKK